MKWTLIGVEPRWGTDFVDWSDMIQLETGILLRRNAQLFLKRDYVVTDKKTYYADECQEGDLILPRGESVYITDIDCWDSRLGRVKTATRCFYPTYEEPVIATTYPGLWERISGREVRKVDEAAPCENVFTLTELEEYFFVNMQPGVINEMETNPRVV